MTDEQPTPRLPPAPTAVAAKEGRVGDDVPCAGCGYNLRTLPAEGQCPECATTVEESLRYHELWTGHRGGRRWIQRGLITWMVAVALPYAALVAMVGGFVFLRPVNAYSAMDWTTWGVYWWLVGRTFTEPLLGGCAVLLVLLGLRTRGHRVVWWTIAVGALCGVVVGAKVAPLLGRYMPRFGPIYWLTVVNIGRMSLYAAQCVAWVWMLRQFASKRARRWGYIALVPLILAWTLESMAYIQSLANPAFGSPGYSEAPWGAFAARVLWHWRPQYETPILAILWLLAARKLYWEISGPYVPRWRRGPLRLAGGAWRWLRGGLRRLMAPGDPAQLLCVHCDYDLRMLPEAGLCPECGHPIRDSEPLDRQSAELLRRLRLGITLVLCGLIGAVGLPRVWTYVNNNYFGDLYDLPYPRVLGDTVPAATLAHWADIIRWGTEAVPTCLAAVGALMLAAAPRGRDGDLVVGQRQLRLAAKALVAWLVLESVIMFLPPPGESMVLAVESWRFLGDVLQVAIAVLVLRQLRRLLRRAPARRAARFARLLYLVGLPVAGGWLVLGAIGATAAVCEPPNPEAPYGFLAPGIGQGREPDDPEGVARFGEEWLGYQFVIVDRFGGMIRTSTCPAEMLDRFDRFLDISNAPTPWSDARQLVGQYVMPAAAVWGGLLALMLLFLLWTIHHSLRKCLATQPPANPSQSGSG